MAGVGSSKSSDRSVVDRPAITEQQWYTLAIVSATLTAVAVVIAFWWIFGDGFDASDLGKAQALSPFGVALFAVVTFCTAGWRGSINTRQANQSESEGRAKLLQEGAKLLAETEKASHVSAGIATLGVLVAGPDKDYAFQAMNLLADFIEDHMAGSHANRHRPQISAVLRTGEQNGLNTGRKISFDCTSGYNESGNYNEKPDAFWHWIPGFERIAFKGGIFDHDDHYELRDLRKVTFHRVNLRRWESVDVDDDRFLRCEFTQCHIASVSSMVALFRSDNFAEAFDRCDFSGCRISTDDLIDKNLKQHDNYYLRGNPPILVGDTGAVDWSKVLLCHDKKPDYGPFLF